MTRDVLPFVAAACSGVLLALCYPPFLHGWLVWIALTPWLAAIWLRPDRGPRAWMGDFILGYIAGTFFFQLAFSWLSSVTTIGTVALNAYLSLYFAAWSVLVGMLVRQDRSWLRSRGNLLLAATVAVAWVGLEYIRSVLFTGFGWNGLGVALWKHLPLIQIADLAGTFGISFLIVFVNVIALATVRRFFQEVKVMRLRPHFDFTVTIGLIGATFVYGVYKLQREAPAVLLKVAIVQANIPQDEKWDRNASHQILDTYRELSLEALTHEPQLLVWPEAATPGPLALDPDSQALVRDLAARGNFDFLLGSLDGELSKEGEKSYNAAFLISEGGEKLQRYWKMHLVPFGEYIPFRKTFPLFAWIAGDQVSSDFDSGTEFRTFQLRSVPIEIAPLICFEDTVPRMPREFVRHGAELLCNLTNDGWFQETQGSTQHLANAIFRSIETRRPMLRAANTGVTCLINEKGAITEELRDAEGSTFGAGVLSGTVRVPINPSLTFYTQWGDWFAWGCVANLVALVLFGRRRF